MYIHRHTYIYNQHKNTTVMIYSLLSMQGTVQRARIRQLAFQPIKNVLCMCVRSFLRCFYDIFTDPFVRTDVVCCCCNCHFLSELFHVFARNIKS